jgi:hypothetical protein
MMERFRSGMRGDEETRDGRNTMVRYPHDSGGSEGMGEVRATHINETLRVPAWIGEMGADADEEEEDEEEEDTDDDTLPTIPSTTMLTNSTSSSAASGIKIRIPRLSSLQLSIPGSSRTSPPPRPGVADAEVEEEKVRRPLTIKISPRKTLSTPTTASNTTATSPTTHRQEAKPKYKEYQSQLKLMREMEGKWSRFLKRSRSLIQEGGGGGMMLRFKFGGMYSVVVLELPALRLPVAPANINNVMKEHGTGEKEGGVEMNGAPAPQGREYAEKEKEKENADRQEGKKSRGDEKTEELLREVAGVVELVHQMGIRVE